MSYSCTHNYYIMTDGPVPSWPSWLSILAVVLDALLVRVGLLLVKVGICKIIECNVYIIIVHRQ